MNVVANKNNRVLDFVLGNIPIVNVMESVDELVKRDNHHPPLEITIDVPVSIRREKSSLPPKYA